MNRSRATAFVIAGLVVGLALGTLGIAAAATSSTAGTQTPPGGWGIPGSGGRGGPGGGMRGRGDLASVVASLTGTTVTDVMTQRQAGKSFAEIAKAKGVTAAQIVSAAITRATADLKSRFEAEVSATGQQFGPAPGGRGGSFGGVAPTGTPWPTSTAGPPPTF